MNLGVFDVYIRALFDKEFNHCAMTADGSVVQAGSWLSNNLRASTSPDLTAAIAG
jgi:hypothetical protein